MAISVTSTKVAVVTLSGEAARGRGQPADLKLNEIAPAGVKSQPVEAVSDVIRVNGPMTVAGRNYSKTSVRAGYRPGNRMRSESRTPTVTDKTLERLNELPHLTYLQLVRTKVTSAGLVHLSNMTRLRELDVLDGPAIGDDGLQCLSGLVNLERLQLLKTSVTDNGLQHLRGLQRLRSLNLDQTTITDAAMPHVALLPALMDLHLAGTHVGVNGMATLSKANNLQHLDISGTKVTDSCMPDIARLANLQSLAIHYSDITDAGILRLATASHLKRLSVGPHVSQDAAKTLRQTLPNCTIEGWGQQGNHLFSLN